MTDWDKRFEAGIGELAPDLLTELVSEAAPETIGPYRLNAEIGRGGMGVVYRSQRDDGQFEQQVAIKLLPNATPDADELRRFERERQILANLNHPNIARLYDGGVARDGRLYLVMELVEGEVLTDYLTRQNPSQSARVKLFEQIVAAVSHAQQQLIVHCDLKPSNIMVTPDGQAKLLDFGVARVMEQSLANATEADAEQMTTTFSYQPLTPAYAAPEHLDARPLGMYTDVYQLGLILYRLLSDEDFRASSSATPVELSRDIVAADQQRIEVLRGRLDADLLAILLRATALEPAARYPGAAGLLDDVHRFQKGYPVSAHLPSPWHRLKKLVLRRPATAIAVATISAASIAFVALLIVQERRVSAQREIAVQQAQSAESVIAYFESILDASVQERGTDGRKTTVHQMLLNSEARLADQFADQPIVQERLRRQHATSFYLTQDVEKAISNAEAAIRAYAAAPPGTIAPRALAENHYILGLAQAILGQQEAGLANHQKAIAIVRASDNPDAEYLAELEVELGTHYLMSQHKPRLALPYLESAARFFEEQLARRPDSESHNDYVYTLRQRAVAYLQTQQYALALADHNTAIGLIKQHFGTIGVADILLREKGRALALLGETDQARDILTAAHAHIIENSAPKLHASIQMLLGQTELLAGNFSEAAELLEASLTGWIEHWGEDMVAVPSTQYLLAQALAGAKAADDALAQAQQALERGQAQFDPQDTRLADFMILVADLLEEPQQSLALYKQAQGIRSSGLPADDWRLQESAALVTLAERSVAVRSDDDEKIALAVTTQLKALTNHEGVVARQRGAVLLNRLQALIPGT